MRNYCREHEAFIKQALKNKKTKINWSNLLSLHHKRLKFLQHERLIHLLVLLAFGTFSLLSVFSFLIINRTEIMFLAIVFLVISIAYVFHYYYLENTTQRWYKISDELEKRMK